LQPTFRVLERTLFKISFAVGILLASAAGAQPRIAVHPLEVGNVSSTQREQLKAQFEVMLARMQGFKMDVAMGKSAATRCEVRDSCLRFIAEATDSLYGVYVRLDALGADVRVVSRVVRVDGAVVRKVSVPLKGRAKVSLVELSREALAQTLRELKLAELEPAPVVLASVPPPPTVVYSERSNGDWKKVAGWSLVGAGGAALVVGGVFAGMAAAGTAANPHDAAGLVPPERAASAAAALRQSNIATILIPTGIAVAAIGAVVVLLPRPGNSDVGVSLAPTGDGLSLSVSGRFQ
jgi:hypothetical protein